MSSPSQLLTSLLKEVSRSFYLTMRILPGAIRPQISLAYLLARTTDTIADTEILPVEKRLEALSNLRARIVGLSGAQLDFGDLARNQSSIGETVLLQRCEEALALLRQFSNQDQERIKEVVDTIMSGQELDLMRFSGATKNQIIALKTEAELDDYTYRVAGCVGEFWTKICVAHQLSEKEVLGCERLPGPSFEQLGIRFGKGLQLVNILRDLPRDLRMGRCYIPQELLSQVGLVPSDLLSSANEAAFRPAYNQLLDEAQEHLAAGWSYTRCLPRSQFRLRLACAWPVLIGAKTLALLRHGKILDPSHRLKISRAEVRNLMLKSILIYPFSSAWDAQFLKAAHVQECSCVR